MAEFCLKCFNEMNGTHYTAREIWLEEDFCEGCGEIKPCVVDLRPKPLIWRMLDPFMPLIDRILDKFEK